MTASIERLVKDCDMDALALLAPECVTPILKGKTGPKLALFLLDRRRPSAAHHECLRWLLERGVDPNLPAPAATVDMSLTAFAATWSTLEQVKLLLEAGGVPDVHCIDALKRSDQPVKLLEALLDAGLDPNFRYSNSSILGLAVTFECGDAMVDLLLARGADPALEVELDDGYRWSAWHAAASNSHHSLAMLIDKVPVHQRPRLDPNDDTPLHFVMGSWCAYGLSGPVIRALLHDPWLGTMATAKGRANTTPGMMGLMHLDDTDDLAILLGSPIAAGIPAPDPSEDFDKYWARATNGAKAPGVARAQRIWSFLTEAALEARVGRSAAGTKPRI